MTNQTNNIPSEFQDIAPYDGTMYHQKITSLLKEPGFEHAIKWVMPGVDYPEFVENVLKADNQVEFQRKVVGPFLEMLVKNTAAGLSCDGIENIINGKSCTYITNHRDIVLDASLLNLCLIRQDLPLTQVAIGNNLLIYDWITDLVKLNRSFIVKRDVKITEALDAAKQLSGYIHYAINELNEPVWIAQREGRAKDSNDVTQESLIKMISLAPGSDVKDNILEANLTPVAISYEYDPNDYLKTREFLLRRRDPEFKKSQHDDLLSMETGILGYKGQIHFHLGKSINDDLKRFDGEQRHEIIRYACKLIDRSIHQGYKIFPCNYIAYDAIEGSKNFSEHYSAEDIKTFNSYIDKQLEKIDIENISDDEREFMRTTMLSMYANPLKNKLAAGGIID